MFQTQCVDIIHDVSFGFLVSLQQQKNTPKKNQQALCRANRPPREAAAWINASNKRLPNCKANACRPPSIESEMNQRHRCRGSGYVEKGMTWIWTLYPGSPTTIISITVPITTIFMNHETKVVNHGHSRSPGTIVPFFLMLLPPITGWPFSSTLVEPTHEQHMLNSCQHYMCIHVSLLRRSLIFHFIDLSLTSPNYV